MRPKGPPSRTAFAAAKAKETKNLFEVFRLSGSGAKCYKPLRPIDDAKLFVRELKHNDKYELFKIVSDFRHAHYINVYKTVFRSWFTYGVTVLFLSLSLAFLSSKTPAFFLPPLFISIYLLWKVSRYKKLNANLTVNDLELFNQKDSFSNKFKTTEQRKLNQGVVCIFVKESKFDDADLEEYDLDDLNESDFDDDSDSDEIERNRKLIGYLVYKKQKDEAETVAILEMCIHSEYRQRRVASNFMRKVSESVFSLYGYRRVAFQVSSFHLDLTAVLKRLMKNIGSSPSCSSTSSSSSQQSGVHKIYTWNAFTFVPGVIDERAVYMIDIAKISERFRLRAKGTAKEAKETKENKKKN